MTAWPLWQLVFPPAEVLQRGLAQFEPSEEEVTERLTMLRGPMRQVVEGQEIDFEEAFS